MERRTYPSLPQGLGTTLKAIEQLAEFDPAYFADEKCPYPEQLKAYLKRLVGPARAGRGDLTNSVFVEGQNDDEEADSLIKEIQSAINAMRNLQEDMKGNAVDVSDRLNFLKNYGSLIDKFLSLKEKAAGVKQMYEFQRIVVEVMEQVLDKDQRLDFKERLKKANLLDV